MTVLRRALAGGERLGDVGDPLDDARGLVEAEAPSLRELLPLGDDVIAAIAKERRDRR